MKFITPVSIEIDETIVEELIKIGYKQSYIECDLKSKDKGYVFVNNYSENSIDILTGSCKGLSNRYYCKNNKDLFLALAAMTDNKNGNYGEYWKCVTDYSAGFKIDKLYKQINKNINETNAFIDEAGDINGRHPNNKIDFIKATKEEIIQYFSHKEMKENKGIIGYKVKDGVTRKAAMNLVLESETEFVPSEMKEGCDFLHSSNCRRVAEKLGVLDILFEPVYKKKEVVIAIRYDEGSFPVVISDKIYVESASCNISISHLEDIIDNLSDTKTTIKGYKIKVSKVDIGCHKGIYMEDIVKVYEEYKSLQ